MKKVGVTGGIGSGKTTVCKIFESINIPVYYADDRAKSLMYRSKPLKQAIKDLLGKDAYHRNGRPNRPFIASQIFNNKKLLAGINNLVHPAVKSDLERWAKEQSAPYVLYEAALLVENGSYKDLDALIVISTEKEERIRRVMKRDKVDRSKVLSRMKNQLPQEKKEAVADYIIDNNGSQSLVKQVWEVHQKLVC